MPYPYMGWLRLVGSLKLYVSLKNIGLFCRALLQKRPIILRSLLIVATPYVILRKIALWGLIHIITIIHIITAELRSQLTNVFAPQNHYRADICKVCCMCCGVLQCVAVCCSVLQCVAVCCCVLQCVRSTKPL